MMLDQRKDSANRARDAGHFIPPGGFNYAIQRNFPPGLWQGDIWHQLCDIFSTEEFAKKCEKGKKNRSSTESSGVTSRHTGGSMGYDEHRTRLEKKLGREVTMKKLFLHTHLTKESKRLYLAGQYDESLEEMEFCTGRSKQVFESYSKNMIQKYGCDETQHPLGDIDVWQSSAGEG